MRSGRRATLNIMVVGTADGIVMVESGSKECSEENVVSAIEFAHEEIKKICAAIEELVKLAGKTKRDCEGGGCWTRRLHDGELTRRWAEAEGCAEHAEVSEV